MFLCKYIEKYYIGNIYVLYILRLKKDEYENAKGMVESFFDWVKNGVHG